MRGGDLARLLIAALLTAPLAAGASRAAAATIVSDPPRILAWHQVGDIGIGMTRARVEYEYGHPTGNSQVGRSYSLHGGNVFVGYDRSEHVDQVRVETPYYKTDGGFGVGYRIPLGACHRRGSVCTYTWQGFTYDNCCTWLRSLVWKGAQMLIIVNVDRGVVQWFSIGKEGTAGSSTRPLAAVAQAITSATRRDACGNKACNYKVTDIRLSKADPTYAGDLIWDPAVGGAAAVLHRTGSIWHVVDLGSSDVGCGTVPPKILNDLHLYCH